MPWWGWILVILAGSVGMLVGVFWMAWQESGRIADDMRDRGEL